METPGLHIIMSIPLKKKQFRITVAEIYSSPQHGGDQGVHDGWVDGQDQGHRQSAVEGSEAALLRGSA